MLEGKSFKDNKVEVESLELILWHQHTVIAPVSFSKTLSAPARI